MASKQSKNADNGDSQELTLLVQDMVDHMVCISALFDFLLSFTLMIAVVVVVIVQNTRFTRMGESIMGRMNEMNARMDELELSIVDLMNQAGLEPTSSPGVSSKSDITSESELGHI